MVGPTADGSAESASDDGPADPASDGGCRVLTGTDIVSIARIESLIAEFGASVAERLFTDAERRYCRSRAHPAQHFAARWAAKEAFLKLLSVPSPAVPTNEIEVRRRESDPSLSLGPAAAAALDERLDSLGATPAAADRSVSLSHDYESGYATAHVVVAVPEVSASAAAAGPSAEGDR